MPIEVVSDTLFGFSNNIPQTHLENGDFVVVCVINAFKELTLCDEEKNQPQKEVECSSCCVLLKLPDCSSED